MTINQRPTASSTRSRIPGRWHIACQYPSNCGVNKSDDCVHCTCGPRLTPGSSLQFVRGLQPFSRHSLQYLRSQHWTAVLTCSESLRCDIIHQRAPPVSTACWHLPTNSRCCTRILLHTICKWSSYQHANLSSIDMFVFFFPCRLSRMVDLTWPRLALNERVANSTSVHKMT